MKIGVVCEGPTDYPAITHFFEHALQERNVIAKFRPLYPDMDQTRPNGGWANVLLWLNNNPPASRIQRYFAGGLFGGSLASEPLDAIIIHLDTDILPEASFKKFVKKHYDFDVVETISPVEKANQIVSVINLSARSADMAALDRAKHVAAPAVESTETWCVAAFTTPKQDFELLAGDQLINSFMSVLERSEGRQPEENYQNINKDHKRRKRFCKKHANGSARIVDGCDHFLSTLDRLISLNPV